VRILSRSKTKVLINLRQNENVFTWVKLFNLADGNPFLMIAKIAKTLNGKMNSKIPYFLQNVAIPQKYKERALVKKLQIIHQCNILQKTFCTTFLPKKARIYSYNLN
jgi:hypothetical protein